MVSLRAVALSEHREKSDKLIDEVEAKDLQLQTMKGLVAETAMVQKEATKLRESDKKGDVNGAILGGLQEEFLAVKKAVPELYTGWEKA